MNEEERRSRKKCAQKNQIKKALKKEKPAQETQVKKERRKKTTYIQTHPLAPATFHNGTT